MEQIIINASQKRGCPLPDKIANAPSLIRGLERVFNAFINLNTCRPVGMGVGFIPWIAIDTYAQRMGYMGANYDEFVELIRAMDEEYMEHERSRGSE